MSQEVVRLSKLTAPAVPDNSKQSKPKEVAAPPTTLSLASTIPIPAAHTEHIPHASSVTSDDNFEMVSSTFGSDVEYDIKVSESPADGLWARVFIVDIVVARYSSINIDQGPISA